jgi:hypothetical protein
LSKEKKVPLVFNAHEYYPLEFDGSQEWLDNNYNSLMKIGTKYLPKVSLGFCVGKSIAKSYEEQFGLKSEIITNAKAFYSLEPKSLKEGAKIKLVHHGATIRSRKLELMIELFDYLDESYTLDFILNDLDGVYLDELKMRAKLNRRIQFLEPVKMVDIPIVLNNYDIGVYILPALNFNDRYAFPNKFFEFIQGRLCLAVSPSEEMQDIVREYDLGLVSEDFTPKALAKKISSLSRSDIYYHKQQSNKYARTLSAEQSQEKIRDAAVNLINQNL